MRLELTEIINYLAPLNPKQPEWMREIKEYGIADKVPIVRDDMGNFLRLLCSIQQPKSILEIGCGISYSTHWMLLGNSNTQITAIDQNQFRIEKCQEFLEKSGFINQVQFIADWGENFLKTNRDTFDLIFLDSVKKDYKEMLEKLVPLLNPGGLIIVDNILFGGKVIHLKEEQKRKYSKGIAALKEFNQAISEHPDLTVSFLPIGDGTVIGRKNS